MGVSDDDRVFSVSQKETFGGTEQAKDFGPMDVKDAGRTLVNSCALKGHPVASYNFNSNNGTDVVANKKRKNINDSDESVAVAEMNRSQKKNQAVKREEPDHSDELLLRSSYCNAAFALSQIKQNRAKGNKLALRIRARIHNVLFRWGCFVDRNAVMVLTLGLLALTVCCLGLIQAHLETNIEKLWVESGGKLEVELQYKEYAIETTRNRLGSDFPVDSVNETSNYEILIQTGRDTATVDSLLLHLKAAEAVARMNVTDEAGVAWDLQDVCAKLPFDVSTGLEFADNLLTQVIPCLVIGPLDCFWEGSKVLGPFLTKDESLGFDLEWISFRPIVLFEQVNTLANFFEENLRRKLFSVGDILLESGASHGYLNRWCLDPNDSHCPDTAPNYKSKKLPNVKEIMADGCNGFAAKKMNWPLDLTLGGISRQPNGKIAGAEGLQTLFSVKSTETFYKQFINDSRAGKNWTREKAEEILHAWQRKFVDMVFAIGSNETKRNETKDTLYAFSGTTINDVLIQFSQIGIDRIVWGYVLMIAYACFSLVRTKASRSQGGVGITGVLLVMLAVAAGLGLCSFIGISFNPASTQVLPFLLLGLGVDDMFLITHHFGEIARMSHIPYKNRLGECLRRVGMSVFLTSISIASGFLFSLVIPMPALRSFGLQAFIVTVFNFIAVLMIYPAILSLDLRRRKHNKLDIFCCFNSSSSPEVEDPDSDIERDLYDDGSEEASIDKSSPQNIVNANSSSKPTGGNRRRTFPVANTFSKVSKGLPNISQFAEEYYGPALMKNWVRVLVLLLFAGILGFSIYECTQVRDGLDLGDVLPRGTREHATLVAQNEYFSFYDMYIVTKEFDYPANQKHLISLHESMANLSYVILNTDGTLNQFWLQYFIDWMKDMQGALDEAWKNKTINSTTLPKSAKYDVKLAYWLVAQTGDPKNPIDRNRIGCKLAATQCETPDKTRLISKDGTILKKPFYNYLTAWRNNDLLNYAVSRPQMIPEPLKWDLDLKDDVEEIPASHPLVYTNLPYFLNNMRENEDFVHVINWVRNDIEKYEKETSIRAYPSGYPFTFWQQYISLRFWLFVALACVILAVFLVLSVVLVNVWIAAIMAFFLAMITIELLGFMGLAGVKLSAVPAVILIASIGVGVELTVHICYAFLTSSGSRKQRVIYSLGHMMGPVVDGAISTLLGVIMLAWAEFDIIVKYFFEVLAVLLFLGLINGIILLPVVLSLIGPSPEVNFSNHKIEIFNHDATNSNESIEGDVRYEKQSHIEQDEQPEGAYVEHVP